MQFPDYLSGLGELAEYPTLLTDLTGLYDADMAESSALVADRDVQIQLLQTQLDVLQTAYAQVVARIGVPADGDAEGEAVSDEDAEYEEAANLRLDDLLEKE